MKKIPNNWKIITIKEACTKITLNGIKIKQKDYLQQGLYPVIDQGEELIGGYYNNPVFLVPDEPPYIIFGDHTKIKKYITFKFIAGADGIKVLKAKSFIHPKLFYYFLHCINIEDKGYARHYQLVEKKAIPIPPIDVQNKIVEKIEELFSELDKGVESLNKVKKQLKIYRQSVLSASFSGKLTNTKLKNGEIPKGWKKVKFIDFCKLQRGYDLPIKKIINGIYPVVTSSGIKGNHNEYRAVGPCLVTGRSGGVGNIHFIKIDKYWPHNTVLFVKDFCGNYPEFLYYYFLQFNFKSFSASTTIPTLDRKQLYNENVFLPPFMEQKRIVEEIESRLSVCDKIEESVNASLQSAESLRQSILKKAFEGKLL